MADIWADPYFGQGDKVKLLVALSIADNARADDGLAWPSLESIARKARTSIRGAQESIRLLEKDKKLEIDAGKGPKGTNVYRVIPRTAFTPESELQREWVQPVRGANRAGCKRAAEKPAENVAEIAAPVCTQIIRNHQESPKTVSEPFSLFWREYPRKLGRGAAVKAWKRYKCDGFADKLMESLRKAKASPDWQKDGGQFIPHPATWLNREGWEDDFLIDLKKPRTEPKKDHPRWAAFQKERGLPASAEETALTYVKEEFYKWLKTNP